MSQVKMLAERNRFERTAVHVPTETSTASGDRVTMGEEKPDPSHKSMRLLAVAALTAGGAVMAFTTGCSAPPPADAAPQVQVQTQSAPASQPAAPLTDQQIKAKDLELREREVAVQEKQLQLEQQQAKSTQQLQNMQKTQLQIQQAKEGYEAGQAIGQATGDWINSVLR
ncbi:MAG TPA: hypothetical protein VGO93_20860 [Candidatus Xenobia bacterium]